MSLSDSKYTWPNSQNSILQFLQEFSAPWNPSVGLLQLLLSLGNIWAFSDPLPLCIHFRIHCSKSIIKPLGVLFKWWEIFRSVCRELKSVSAESYIPWAWYDTLVLKVLVCGDLQAPLISRVPFEELRTLSLGPSAQYREDASQYKMTGLPFCSQPLFGTPVSSVLCPR